MRKQKGFSLIELLIVVAIILIIAAIAIPNMMRAKMQANDASAATSMRQMVTGEMAYFAAFPTVGYTNLLALGGALNVACTPGTTTACLVDSNLANNGTPPGSGKSGYGFASTPISSGAIGALNDEFLATGTPMGVTTGVKAYCAIDDGIVRMQAAGNITLVGSYASCQNLTSLLN